MATKANVQEKLTQIENGGFLVTDNLMTIISRNEDGTYTCRVGGKDRGPVDAETLQKRLRKQTPEKVEALTAYTAEGLLDKEYEDKEAAKETLAEYGIKPRRTATANGNKRHGGGGKPSKYKLNVDKDEVFAQAQKAIEEGAKGWDRSNSYVVELPDGRKVAPKWLVSLLTGIPASTFNPIDGIKALQAVGIETTKKEKATA